MNGTYYPNPTFLDMDKEEKKEEKEIINTGKKLTVYTSIDKVFTGRFEQLTNNCLIISDKNYYLIPIKFINYIESEEEFKLKEAI